MASRWRAVLCLAVQLLLLVRPLAAAAAEGLGGTPQTAEEQFWAFRDSAAALHARGMYEVALQEIDEALLLRPGDAEATTLRDSILAAKSPPPPAPVAAAEPTASGLAMASSPATAPDEASAIDPVAVIEGGPSSIVDRLGRTIMLRLPLPVLLVQSPALDEWSKALDRLAERDLLRAEALVWRGLLKDPGNTALQRAAHLLEFVRRLGEIGPAPGTTVQIDLNQAALALVTGGGSHLGADLERWRQLVLAYLGGRGFGAPVRLSEPQKIRTEAALLFGEVLGEACMRQAEAALVNRWTDDALLALQAAAVLAPHNADLRRWVATLDGQLE